MILLSGDKQSSLLASVQCHHFYNIITFFIGVGEHHRKSLTLGCQLYIVLVSCGVDVIPGVEAINNCVMIYFAYAFALYVRNVLSPHA